MTATTAPEAARSDVLRVTDRLRQGYEDQDHVGMAGLYAEDATWELHVGAESVRLHGRPAIAERYAADLRLPPTVLLWEVRLAPWGAVVEAEAEQGSGADRVRFRWVQLLTVERGRVVRDVVHCTGAVPAPA